MRGCNNKIGVTNFLILFSAQSCSQPADRTDPPRRTPHPPDYTQKKMKINKKNIQNMESYYTLFNEYCSLIEIIDEFSKFDFLKEVSKLLSKFMQCH